MLRSSFDYLKLQNTAYHCFCQKGSNANKCKISVKIFMQLCINAKALFNATAAYTQSLEAREAQKKGFRSFGGLQMLLGGFQRNIVVVIVTHEVGARRNDPIMALG